MKKTLTVNLGGTVYHIDDDAYRLLDNYLSNLKHYFRKQESAEEIINDIEMRIAELFAEKVAAGKQVVTVQDVEEVIARVGKPEDFGITEDDAESNKRTEQSSSASQTYTRTAGPRRLFGRISRLGYNTGAYSDDCTGVCSLLPDDYTLYSRVDCDTGGSYSSREIKYAWRSGDD